MINHTFQSENKALCLIPIIFSLHNLEEYLYFSVVQFPGFLPLPAIIQTIQSQLNAQNFLLAIITITLISWLLWGTWHFLKAKWARTGLYILQAILGINVLTHLMGAIPARQYTMGLVTALLINLPFSILLFHSALNKYWLEARNLIPIFAAAILLHGPGLIGFLLLMNTLL